MQRLLVCALALGALSSSAAAEPCPGNPDALGTARVLTVDPAGTPRVGRKQFPATLPLQDKELVLTFDDGPWPATTPAILHALKRECVRATFFLLGRNAADAPALVRREAAEGHSIGTSQLFASAAQPHGARPRGGRDRPRHRRRRGRALPASPAASP